MLLWSSLCRLSQQGFKLQISRSHDIIIRHKRMQTSAMDEAIDAKQPQNIVSTVILYILLFSWKVANNGPNCKRFGYLIIFI